MSRKMDGEIAEHILNPSIIEQAFTAARSYPELKIRCPWCSVGVFGADFGAHGQKHIDQAAEQAAETPSSWMAL
jgi:hypothetical protein